MSDTPTDDVVMTGPVAGAGDVQGAAAETFRVFVGYDSREDIAYRVCRRSLLRRSSVPVAVIPIVQQELRSAGLYWRERGPTESTEFSFTRFLTPHLAGYRGWALFVDCDFLFVADVAELARMADPRYAVLCVHHSYAPKEATKMDGAVQTVYPRKNWSSMVLFNCAHPKNRAALTPEAVSTQSGAYLHRFMWLDDADIGEVPFVWNFLVGHNRFDHADTAGTAPRAIHYTSGGPWFEQYKNCEFAELWVQERDAYEAEAEEEEEKEEHEAKAILHAPAAPSAVSVDA
uniref:Glycosyltransferase n=1 Tax=Oryza barthii TaxID=65489 RepID=A0A0D3GQ14_9ORYZ